MQFPLFVFGTAQQVAERARPEATAWAAAFEQRRSLPDHSMREINPGELVYAVLSGDVDQLAPHWRLFGLSFMPFHLLEASREVVAALQSHIRATPWGALAEAIDLQEPNTVDAVTARLRMLFTWWEPLSTLRYRGRGVPLAPVMSYPHLEQPVMTLDELVAQSCDTALDIWGSDQGELRARLEHALVAMSNASSADTRERLINRMVALAREDTRLRKLSALTDRELIATRYDDTTPERREALRAGVRRELKNFLLDVADTLAS
jgi:hypothetical protein